MLPWVGKIEYNGFVGSMLEGEWDRRNRDRSGGKEYPQEKHFKD